MKTFQLLTVQLSFALALSPLSATSALAAVPMAQVSPSAGLQSLPPETRGDLLMLHQQYVEAIEAYQQAPADAALWNKIGMAYHHMLAFDQAKKDYARALKMRPNYPEAMNNLAAAYFAQRNYKKAIHLYRHALKLMPYSATIAANLGTAYFAEGKFETGMAAYRRAFALDPMVFASDSIQTIPSSVSLHERARQDYCLAELFAQSGMLDQAIEYLRKAFDEGFSDRSHLMQDGVFAQLRKTSQFAHLMAEQGIH